MAFALGLLSAHHPLPACTACVQLVVAHHVFQWCVVTVMGLSPRYPHATAGIMGLVGAALALGQPPLVEALRGLLGHVLDAEKADGQLVRANPDAMLAFYSAMVDHEALLVTFLRRKGLQVVTNEHLLATSQALAFTPGLIAFLGKLLRPLLQTPVLLRDWLSVHSCNIVLKGLLFPMTGLFGPGRQPPTATEELIDLSWELMAELSGLYNEVYLSCLQLMAKAAAHPMQDCLRPRFRSTCKALGVGAPPRGVGAPLQGVGAPLQGVGAPLQDCVAEALFVSALCLVGHVCL